MHYLFTALSLIPFYLLGCFPTGKILGRLHKLDITLYGSGNVGAANVTRVLGVKAGLITLLLDAFKGFAAVKLASVLSPDSNLKLLAAIAVVAGHCFSIPGKSKGGKGVATSLGVLLGVNPLLALLSIITFCSVLYFSKFVSLASVLAALLTPIFAFLLNESDLTAIAMVVLALIIVLRHLTNLKRISEGKELDIKKNNSLDVKV